MRPAVFLDRDGVVIENRSDYVKSWEEVEFLDGAADAMKRLATSKFRVVVVTNQAVVGRGIVAEDKIRELNGRVIEVLRAAGGRIDRAYLCPHHPDDDCACRKPRPGMLARAAAELDIDLARSYMVGDAFTDIQAGRAAGTQPILVRTGRGEVQLEKMQAQGEEGFYVVPDLAAAVDYILSKQEKS